MRALVPFLILTVLGACATSLAPISSSSVDKTSPAVRNILELGDLRREVAELRNQVELQQHEVEDLRRRQSALYNDLDQRLRGREGQQTAAGPGSTLFAESTERRIANNEPGLSSDERIIATAPSTIASAEEQTAYDNAFELLGQSQYAEAITAFDLQIKSFPGGSLADDAQYWIGESHYVNRNLKAALTAYEQLTEVYVTSNRYPEALLKIGYLHDDLGHIDLAKQVLQKVIQQYPGSRTASSAEARLNQINQ